MNRIINVITDYKKQLRTLPSTPSLVKNLLNKQHKILFLNASLLYLIETNTNLQQVMKNGKIAQAGKFEELMKQNIFFEALVGAHSEALESILAVKNNSRTSENQSSTDVETSTESTSNAELQNSRHDSEHNLSIEITEDGGKLVQDEEREKGSIGKEVYWFYLKVVKGGAFIPIILLAQSTFQFLQVSSNYWMAWACPPTSKIKPRMEMNFVLLVYVILAVGSSLCVLLRAMLVAIDGLWTAQKLFMNMLHSVLRAPMAFFDSTPTGRILNRVRMT